ncbi:hypothetical protein Q8O96_30905 [Pseudomonas sp. LPH60]|uniref:hypothetical protein n=1 Tax=Pseudomonas sp. LPH60 TaxID=3065906 RepID=UPI00273AC328|nr:hypothetical protein [Pseudomonas sp. LPH60]MDP4573483.1 hypothetical protein [Pseudomonas sp. LPH60]
MKILMVVAVLTVVASVALGDVILGAFAAGSFCFAGAAVFAVRKLSSRSARMRLYADFDADADAVLPPMRVGRRGKGLGIIPNPGEHGNYLCEDQGKPMNQETDIDLKPRNYR